MKNTDVLKSLFDLGEKILFPADNVERASNGTHKIYNSVSSIVVDNEDKENWFGLIFKDACIFKYEQTLKNGSKFFQATTEINEVVNRYMPIMDIISSENSIKVNLNTTLPIYKGADRGFQHRAARVPHRLHRQPEEKERLIFSPMSATAGFPRAVHNPT